MVKKIEKSKQTKNESDSESNSDDRWLQEEINAMKKRMITKSLYENKYQEEMEDEDSGDGRVQWVRVAKRSIVWRHFLFNKKTNRAICVLCDTIYQLGGASTTIMLYHLRTVHPQKLANTQYHGTLEKIVKTSKTLQMAKPKKHKKSLFVRISEGKCKVRVAHAQIFSQLPLHFNTFQTIRLLQSKFNYDPSEARILVNKNFWANENTIDFMIEKLNKNQNVVILGTQNKIKQTLCFISHLMRQNLFRFQDLISLWYMKKPIQNSQIHAVIYIVVQSKNIQPLIAGLIVLLTQDETKTLNAIENYFSYVNFRPKNLIVCGPFFLIEGCKKIVNMNCTILESSKRLHIIHLNTDIDTLTSSLSINKFIQSVNSQLLGRKETSFIGFTLSTNFIERIIQFSPAVLGKKQSLTEYLLEVFYLQKKINDQAHGKQSIQRIQILQWLQDNYPQILHLKTLKTVKSMVQPNIYKKFFYSYLYGKYLLNIQPRSEQEFIISEIHQKETNCSNVIKQPIIVCEVLSNSWVCTCSLKQLFGLPCPHIIRVICQNKEEKLNLEIHERWLKSSPQKNIEINNVQRDRLPVNRKIANENFINERILLALLYE